MYLNTNKSDTNIDKEFNNKNHHKSGIANILNKYKKIIFAILAIIIVIIIIIVILSTKDRDYLILNGETNMIIYQNSDYIEEGYKAYNSDNIDLTNQVLIESNLDTNKIGTYEIIYSLNNIKKKRQIKVIEKPSEYTYIYLKPVNNEVNVYLKVGQDYIEPGYQVFNSSGKNLTNEVKITGTVDTSKKGNYKLVYSVVDSNNVTISVTRTVSVS